MGTINIGNNTDPSTPSAGRSEVYVDSTSKKIKSKDDTGAVTTYAGDATTTKGDILARSTTAIDRLPVGADGEVLTADSAQALGVKWNSAPGDVTGPASSTDQTIARFNGATGKIIEEAGLVEDQYGWKWSTGRYAFVKPERGFVTWDQFVGTASGQNNFGWDQITGGSAAVNWDLGSQITDGVHDGRVGQSVRLFPDAGTSGSNANIRTARYHNFGHTSVNMKIRMGIEVWVSGTSSNLIDVIVGVGTPTTSITPTDSPGYIYYDGNNSTWFCGVAKDGTRTTANTGVTVSATTLHHLEFEYDESAGETKFWIDGTLTNTLTTNLPTLGDSGSIGITALRVNTSGVNRWVWLKNFYYHELIDTDMY